MFWLLLIALLGLWTFSETLFPPDRTTGTDVNVRDGDTLIMGGKAFRIEGIDAPEYHQSCKDAQGKDWACGKAARAHLDSLTKGGAIVCEFRESDRYGRALARCAAGAGDLGEAMVAAGFALGPDAYPKTQAIAREAKRGIWQGSFEDPAAWRAAHPREDIP
jgi:endonuclease YncB( thermonuclease family)